MSNTNKTGLTIFILCLIIAIILYLFDYEYAAYGLFAVGVICYFAWPKHNA